MPRHFAPLALAFLVPALAGCATLRLEGLPPMGSSPEPAPSEQAAPSSGTTPAEANAETPEEAALRQKAEPWFAKCSARYDDFMKRWKPVDDEAKRVIAETKGASFYDAFPKLASQYRKVRAEARKMKLGDRTTEVTYAFGRGTALELLLAIGELQLRAGKAISRPVELQYRQFKRSTPMVGDDAFDRAQFCSCATYEGTGDLPAFSTADQDIPAPWMKPAERRAFKARVRELSDAATKLFRDLEKADQASRPDGAGAVVKGVKKSPEGATVVSARHLGGGYACEHTGNYTWNGVSWNDCNYVSAKPIEGEAFEVTFEDLPPGGLRPGDEFNFLGRRDGSKWEGLVVNSVTRRGKPVYEGAINDRLDHAKWPR